MFTKQVMFKFFLASYVQIIYKKGMRLGYEINRLTTHGNVDRIDAPG